MIGTVVLAAGDSTRMGRPKAMLPFGSSGTTFLERILKTLREGGVDVVRVVVPPGRASWAGDDAAVNPDPARGMLSSVQRGIRALPGSLDAFLLWPVDHPLVKSATLAEILRAFRERDAPVVVPVHAGRRGHPGLFAARVVPEILAADPAHGAREVVHAHADRLELPVEDAGVVTGIDTPEDYRRAFGEDLR